jgi:hypothetical protein
MLFNFLRQYFKDEEFEQTKLQLKESHVLLNEYKKFIDKEKEQISQEKEKVDPDFLVMVWVSIGIALSIGVEAIKNLPKSNQPVEILKLTPVEYIWLGITIYSVFFMAYNGMFALELTLRYANSKRGTGYKAYAVTLAIGIVLVFIGLVIIGYFNNK